MPDPTEMLADWKAKTDAAAEAESRHPSWHDRGVAIVQGSHWRAGFKAGFEYANYRPLLAAVESVLRLHTAERVTWSTDPRYQVCTSCNQMWPCPTVRAIESALGGGDDAA
jgi:hypothetical protein